ncbi:MAG TPA: hypothetical protein VHZ28_18475 [Terracidiphilus sp.]|jgi:hypothetical protein|nr:hypothetical protein [Terracidiphilus sp.]
MATNNPAPATQLDVVFDGTWIFLPQVDASGTIIRVDVYSPNCGHPHAGLFLSQLGPFGPLNWPPLNSFYMLNSQGLTLSVQATGPGIGAKNIDHSINHCIPKKRPMCGNWDLQISLVGVPSAWVSTGTQDPVVKDPSGKTVACFSGKDAPAGKISSIQTLSFWGVTAVDLCGAPDKLQNLIPGPYAGPGTLLLEGEVPYIPSLQHERSAISSMATLAGLDLLLEHPLPSSGSATVNPVMMPRVAGAQNCGHGVLIGP